MLPGLRPAMFGGWPASAAIALGRTIASWTVVAGTVIPAAFFAGAPFAAVRLVGTVTDIGFLPFGTTGTASGGCAAHFLIALGHCGAAREFHAAFFIHAQAFHPDFIADLEDVLGLLHAAVGEFAD